MPEGVSHLQCPGMTQMKFSPPHLQMITGMLGSMIGLLVGAVGVIALTSAGVLNLDFVRETHSTGVAITEAGGRAEAEVSHTAALRDRIAALESAHNKLADALRTLHSELEGLRTAKAAGNPPTNASVSNQDQLQLVEIEAIVHDVLEQKRLAQEEARARLEDERRTETAELSEGPYGAYNYQVNRMSRALQLTSNQGAAYYQLLIAYAEESASVTQQIQQELAWDSTPGEEMQHRIHALLTRTTEIESKMQEEFSSLLQDWQVSLLDAMPPEQRGFGGPIVIAESDLRSSSPPRQ
jgi:hypothetical protein